MQGLFGKGKISRSQFIILQQGDTDYRGYVGGLNMKGMNDAEKINGYVLVIDANAVDRFSTCMLLQRFGCNIFSVGTAQEAIEFMNIEPPVAVVAEAGLTGSTLLSHFMTDHRLSNIPLILLLSRNAALGDHRTLEGKATAYLSKPINVEEFYRIVQAVIEKGARRNIRIATHITATLEDELTGGGGCVTALSEYGMFFRSFDPLPPHTHIPVSFEIKGRTILLEAIVLYSTTADEGPFKEPGMGMKFDKISPVDRDLIKTFILDQFKEGMSRPSSYNC